MVLWDVLVHACCIPRAALWALIEDPASPPSPIHSTPLPAADQDRPHSRHRAYTSPPCAASREHRPSTSTCAEKIRFRRLGHMLLAILMLLVSAMGALFDRAAFFSRPAFHVTKRTFFVSSTVHVPCAHKATSATSRSVAAAI